MINQKSNELMDAFNDKISQTYKAFSALEFLNIVQNVTGKEINIDKLGKYNQII